MDEQKLCPCCHRDYETCPCWFDDATGRCYEHQPDQVHDDFWDEVE